MLTLYYKLSLLRVVISGDLRTLLKQIRSNTHVEQSHKIALFWINIGMSYDEVRKFEQGFPKNKTRVNARISEVLVLHQ